MNIKTFNKANNLLEDINHYESCVSKLSEELKNGSQLSAYTDNYEFKIPKDQSDKLIKEELQRLNTQLKEWREEFKNL